jgi:predicted transcriptional regulator of viral defense system
MISPTEQAILERIQAGGIVRPRDVSDLTANPTAYLQALTNKGLLARLRRGLYAPADLEITERHSLAEVAKLVPDGVVCLLSALAFHGIGTQNPSEVWMALNRPPSSAGGSGSDAPPLRLVRFSGAAWERGVEQHKVEGVPIRVYSPAKTVVDCFRCRNKIGLDVASEALRDCWRRKRLCSVDELWGHARACRVASVIRPHLEALA